FLIGQDGVAGQEGKWLGDVEEAQLLDDEFDLTGGDIGIDRIRVALFYSADGGDDVFVAEFFGLGVDGGIEFVAENDLRHASTVAEIDENNLAEIAAPVHPSHEDGFFACVSEAKGPAHMSSSKIA